MIYFYLGHYANGPGSSSCQVCPTGFECIDSTNQPQPCPKGYYCLSGTDPRGYKQACPVGTFGQFESLQQMGNCTDCPPGKFCETAAATNYSGPCQKGFWCQKRALSRTPEDGETFGRCPRGGYYCPEGSSTYLPCPAGHFSAGIGLTSVSECTPCTEGKFCASGNQSAPTGDCLGGFYCSGGSPVSDPKNEIYGSICPSGTKCPLGSGSPTPCPAGEYNNDTKQETCKQCPAGFYCPGNSTYPISCPSGYWCESGTKTAHANACPPGTFNGLRERTSSSECNPCTAGFYCEGSGKVTVLLRQRHFQNSVKSLRWSFYENKSMTERP